MRVYQEKLVGVFGDPVDENPTCVIQQAGFDALGIPYRYLTIQVHKGDLETAMKGMRAMNFAGIGITMPHKQEVIKYLDRVSESASIMGAVNMVYWKDGELFGENVDGKGFMMSLQNGGIDVRNKKAVILGAGGVARAITVELANAGVSHIMVVNIEKASGEELTDILNKKTPAAADFVFWDNAYSIPEDTDILVNATSVGFANENDRPNIVYDTIKTDMIVCDVIPNRITTRFLDAAKEKGCRTFNGLGMLINQGILCFELWTGEKAPVQVMAQALKNEFGIKD